MIQRIKQDTLAEIIVLTPNQAVHSPDDHSVNERVEIVHNLAKKYKLSLVDVYEMWNEVVPERKELKLCLSNRMNHPTPLGHTFMDQAIMQLFEEEENEKNN